MLDGLLSAQTYQEVLIAAYIFVVLVVLGAAVKKAPYGRFAEARQGFSVQPQLGWFLMEIPAMIFFTLFYFMGDHRFETVPLFFLAIWLIHYSNRSIIFPLLMRVPAGQTGSFSWLVVTSGWVVMLLHSYLNAVFIAHLSTHMTIDWFTDPRFIIGMAVYWFGFFSNLHCDHILRNLRTKAEVAAGEKVYRIPQGGLFKYVSSPSYLTEIISFIGFAIATWSLGALFVLGVTAANLIPRAIQTHRWYQERFADYPQERKILVPGLW